MREKFIPVCALLLVLIFVVSVALCGRKVLGFNADEGDWIQKDAESVCDGALCRFTRRLNKDTADHPGKKKEEDVHSNSNSNNNNDNVILDSVLEFALSEGARFDNDLCVDVNDANSGLLMRTQPSCSATALFVLRNGTRLTRTDTDPVVACGHRWFHVKLKGTTFTGWVSSYYLGNCSNDDS